MLQSELDEQVGAMPDRFKEAKQELPPENVLRQQVLERLVVQELQMQRAQHSNLKVPDETLNGAMQDIAQRNGVPLSRLPEVLSQNGIDYASYREAMRKELTLALLRQREVLQRINVTPREVDQYLEKQKNAPEQSAEYNVSHILIAVPQTATPEQLEESDRKAKMSPSAPAKAKTSPSSRSRTPTARPRSRAAHSAGARARSCPPSCPKSSRS